MLNVEENNYRQNVTGNADSVTLNAYANNNSNAYKLRGSGCDSVLLRTPRFVNTANHAENARFLVKNIVFAKMMVKGMRGIVKIPSHKVRSFNTVATMQKLAHHFLPTLKNVDLRCKTVSRVSTFNPLVTSSNLVRPTTQKHKPPCTKVWGVFFRPCSTTKTLCEHFVFHAVRRRC
jgi:hypothetical protein